MTNSLQYYYHINLIPKSTNQKLSIDLTEFTIFFFFFTFFSLIELGPNGQLPFRAMGIGQRPFIDSSSFSSHLRDLETYRRKAPAITSIPSTNTNTISTHQTTNGLLNSDCQGYKPNAPQISGKISK